MRELKVKRQDLLYRDEKDISAQQNKEEEEAWIQGKDEDKRWKKSDKEEKEEREEKTYTLKLDQSLPKKEILRDLDFVFKRGKFFRGKFLVLYHIDSEEKKFGVAVSKKIKKKVKRNRLKRLVREAYRKNKNLYKGINVFLVRDENLTYMDAEEEVKKLAEFLKNV